MKRKWRYIAVGAALVAAIAAGRWLWLQQREEPVRGLAAQTMAAVQRGTLTASVSGTGSIEPVERKTVAAASAGTVAEG
ncbi:hypothetical protein [Thermobacillus composti]|uniref:hypothetical protein n=1 Tax=Thermobacillus composti TaxID=377615 RepID=UPI001E480A00|nr:hypothetical protein [Thermobacillus composti]